MQPRITHLTEKYVIGKSFSTSYIDNKTFTLWQSFMPAKKQIPNCLGSELFSIEVYPPAYFDVFDPVKEFKKWAAVEVMDLINIPPQMEAMTLPVGLYAVFIHFGLAINGPETYRAIFEGWLPKSGYGIDQRPHFAIMGNKYLPNSTDSEEEIWIPIKLK
ncbi:AraC family transcriptional regulator [Mucilaginibacter sp. PAMC 26640]|nr:AraC family transcriptional regulator [Mucilaginibacter sp. PAMC 26640]